MNSSKKPRVNAKGKRRRLSPEEVYTTLLDAMSRCDDQPAAVEMCQAALDHYRAKGSRAGGPVLRLIR